jgi:integrase
MPKPTARRFGSIRLLPSGRFQARWEGPDGYQHKAPDTFASRDAAERWLAGVRVDRADGSHIDERDSGIVFGAYADLWRQHQLMHLRASSRIRDLGYLDRYLMPRWGAIALHDITSDDIRSWIADLGDDDDLAPATVTKAGQILSKILQAAVDATPPRLARNPAKGVRLPRTAHTEMTVLGPDQIDDLADAIDPRWRGLIYMGCYCGLRIGEMAALRVGDVNLVTRQITVLRSLTEVEGHQHLGATKTRAGRRVVPLPRQIVAELTPHLDGKHPDDLVFPNTEGGYLRTSNFRQFRWRPATRAVGLPGFRIHDMRHTAISLWVEAGEDPVQIAAWAGHTSVVTVLDRYGHLRPRAEQMSKLDALLQARRPAPANVTPIR